MDKLKFFDLKKCKKGFLSYNPQNIILLGGQDELWEDGIYSIIPVSAEVRIQSMRQSVSRKLQGSKLFMLGSILVHVLCAINLQGKPQRHRSMFKLAPTKAVSHGVSWLCIQVYLSRCKRKQRLSYLSGFRTHPHRHSTQIVSRRRPRHRFATNHICSGLADHRPLPDDIPMGTISQKEGGDKITYAFRCAWKHTNFYQCNSWESSRCEYDEYLADRRQFCLCYGQRLHGFSKALSDTYYTGFLCNKGETKFAVSQIIFKSSGQNDGHSSRSDYRTLR